MKTELEIYVEVAVLVRVTAYTPGDPGRVSGPPEACYPPEAEEIEFEVIGMPSIDELENSEKIYDMVLEAYTERLEDHR
jgi:hypothetical protein